MNKSDILNYLSNLELDKNNYIVISGASLVLQDVIEDTKDIDLACSKSYYNSIPWHKRIGAFGIEIKYNTVFEIGYNLYFPEEIVMAYGYKCLEISKCIELKAQLNREKDKEIIEKFKN